MGKSITYKFENGISLSDVEDILFNQKKMELSDKSVQRARNCYIFLKNFSKEKIIYDINTGFGPMAQYRVDDDFLKQLQYNIIRSHSTGAGESLSPLYVKASIVEMFNGNTEKIFKHKVQAFYSLRCVPQILDPIWDELENAEKVLINELNSACDNPIVDPETKNVYHGGNFHDDYISFEMDKLKIAVTKMIMLIERQMNYLFHDRINDNRLPPFVNLGVLGLNYGLQAAPFTATSTTAECQTWSNLMYVHSIPNNNDNQDIVSMGTNSALIAKTVIENGFQVMSIHLMALVQAIYYLKIQKRISKKSRGIYDEIRAFFPIFAEDMPKYKDIESMRNYLITKKSR